jgi:hypothetical protein
MHRESETYSGYAEGNRRKLKVKVQSVKLWSRFAELFLIKKMVSEQ